MKIAGLNCEDARLVELDVTHKGKTIAWLHVHWSLRAGMYGHQIAIRFNKYYNEDGSTNDDGYQEYKTGGWGFCKESAAFDYFLDELLGCRTCVGGGINYCLGGTKYHVGGNYYKVPLTVLKRLVKNKGIK